MRLSVRGWLTIEAIVIMLLASLIVMTHQTKDNKSFTQTTTREAQVIHIEHNNNIVHVIDTKGNQWSFINRTRLQEGDTVNVVIGVTNAKEKFLTYY